MWLYLPKETLTQGTNIAVSRYALDLADWNLACISQNPDIEPFVISSGKCLPRPLSWRGWKTRPWMMRLSGMTLSPSTAARGVAKWISSLPDTLASHSPSAASDAATKTLAIFGRMWRGSSAKPSLNGSSARMSKGISIWDLPKSRQSFKKWGLRSKQACFQRMKQERTTRGGVYSCWPTPTMGMSGNQCEWKIGPDGLIFQTRTDQVGSQIGLSEVARSWTAWWLGCVALGMKPVSTPTGYPYSHPLHLRCRPGTRLLPGELTFNPNFSDWIMGWPIGWSDPSQPVTEWSVWLRRSRTALSELLSMNRMASS